MRTQRLCGDIMIAFLVAALPGDSARCLPYTDAKSPR